MRARNCVAIREHVTKFVYLPKYIYISHEEKVRPPQLDPRGVKHRFVEPDELLGLVVGSDPDEESGIPSASSDGVEGSGIASAPRVPVGPESPGGVLSASDDVPRDSDPRLAPGEPWAFGNRGRRYTAGEFSIKSPRAQRDHQPSRLTTGSV